MKDVMLDLETLGLKAGSVILSIGAVEFDPHSDKLGASVRLSHRHAVKQPDAGFKIDPNTFYWWLAQDDAARRNLTNGKAFAEHLGHVLGSFQDWLGDASCGAGATWTSTSAEARL
jgi:cation diffusion facilitator CzcD-associated flavoprotein CzcO